MPKVFLTNPEKIENVTRPVAMGMVQQIFKLSGLPENTRVMYNGTHNQALQTGTSLTGGDDTVKWPHDAKVTIDVQEDYAEDRLSSQVLNRPENLFIFKDDKLETYIKPVYSTTRVEITFTSRFKDDVSAKKWRDDFKTRLAEGRDARLFEAIYHYPIPEELLKIVEEIYTLREHQGGYGETLDQYFMDHADPRVTVLVNQAGKGGLIVIPETQGRIVGLFDFNQLPQKGELDGDGENWEISIPFAFHYEQPVGCDMSYPLMIHNQLIKYRPEQSDMADVLLHRKDVRTLSGVHLNQFEAGTSTYKNKGSQGLQIPSFDEFIPSSIVNGTLRVFTALVSITPDDKKTLMNLKDIFPEYEYEPKILEFMLREAPWMTQPYQSIFHVSLYRSINLQHAENITVDADLNVSAVNDLDIREYYHIRFSIVYDLASLSQPAKDRSTDHACALQTIIDGIDPRLPKIKIYPVCRTTPNEIDKAADGTTELLIGKGNQQIIQFNTVQTFFIEAHKEKLAS